MDRPELRAAIVAEARRWLRTPYCAGARRRGRGCDCATLVQAVYEAVGLLPPIALGRYDAAAAWAAAGGDAQYVGTLAAYARAIPEAAAGMGDLVMYRLGRGWSHSAIIVRWPGEVIHALVEPGVIATTGHTGRLASRAVRFWSFLPEA